ncbi:NAD-dependent epimerase/dehydratase family protein [Candidatus Parcubacteria bacterium]|nr:NAD-dependent epimerase/dehydratase family protein [Candidatus Parcubacteria bacterium]
MSKVLITGGAGFIGSNLADELIKIGDDVVIIDNLISGKKECLNPKAKFYEIDICSSDIEKIFKKEKFDYVFHLAAKIDVRKSIEDPVFDNKVNVLGSLAIFKHSAKNRIKKVIFASTGGALYGDISNPAIEEDLIYPLSPYAIHKYAAERYLELQKELYNLNYAVLRLANVYGPRQYKGGECGVIGIFTHNAVVGDQSILYGDGSKTRDYAYVDDIVSAMILSKNSKYTGVFNIGAGKETSVLNLIETIEKITKKRLDYKREKDKLGEVKRSALNYNKAKKFLKWRPRTDLETGIKQTLAWLKNKDFIKKNCCHSDE